MRSFRLPTASSLERALACPQSCALPSVDSGNPAAAKGTGIHRFIELITNGVERAYALEAIDDPAARAFCEELDIAKLDIPEDNTTPGVRIDPLL